MKENYRKYLIEGEKAGMRYTLTVPRDALAGFAGVELGHQAGSSIDFKDYREYQPGDDLRYIDWHLYGRTDRLNVKLYREEVYPHVDIILDGSCSMALEGTEKGRGALGLSALLATAAANSRCTHKGWLITDAIKDIQNGAQTPSFWEDVSFDYAGSPLKSFTHPPAWRKRGIRIFISDLLWIGEPLSALKALSQSASAVIVIQLLSKADTAPPAAGNTRLVDVETGEILELFIDTVAKSSYTDGLSAHQQNWHRSCRQTGAIFSTLIADEIVGNWKLDVLQEKQILGAA